MRDKTQRRIIVLPACDSSAEPTVAARQLRISCAIAHDFADAVAAYSRLSATQAPKVELTELKTWQEAPQQAEPTSLVLVGPLSTNDAHTGMPSEAIEHIVKSIPRSNEPLIYVVAYGDAAPSASDRQALAALRPDIERMGANWGGALLFGGADTFEHLYRLPRLGTHRRPISKAIDLLVCAARLDEPLDKAMRSIGHEDPCNLICAQPGLPSMLRLHQAIWHR